MHQPPGEGSKLLQSLHRTRSIPGRPSRILAVRHGIPQLSLRKCSPQTARQTPSMASFLEIILSMPLRSLRAEVPGVHGPPVHHAVFPAAPFPDPGAVESARPAP